MGGNQRLAAVAAVSHARHYYNLTQPDVTQTETTQYSVNIFFISATLCGVLVAVCAACWPRAPPPDKPDDAERPRPRQVYTVSRDMRARAAQQLPEDLPEPPPAYDTVVVDPPKDCLVLQEVVTERCPCPHPPRLDSGLPSYEAAVLLRDTKL